jgi:very-short-patch-repair endonuclease
MDADGALARHAAAHHGIFRGEHARLAGLTERQIVRRIGEGRWLRLYRDVYRLDGAPPSWMGDLLAATWAGGFRAVGSHRSAAEVHWLPGRDRDLVEITCRRWRRARHGGLVVHETKALDVVDITMVDGIPVTTPARTLFDLCSIEDYGFGLIELAFENGLRRGLFSMSEIAALERRLSRSGREGGPTIRRLLAARDTSRLPTESDMETRLLQTLRKNGLPTPVAQYEVRSENALIARVDFAYPEAKIAIEYDSDEFHSGRNATRRDRSRRHRLLEYGWITVDVGPAELRRGAGQALSAIARALRDRTRTAS